MRRLLWIIAMLAVCGPAGHAQVACADPTWSYLPSLPPASESQLQLFLDAPAIATCWSGRARAAP